MSSGHERKLEGRAPEVARRASVGGRALEGDVKISEGSEKVSDGAGGASDGAGSQSCGRACGFKKE